MRSPGCGRCVWVDCGQRQVVWFWGGGLRGEIFVTCIFFCSKPSVQFGLHRAAGSFLGFRAAPRHQFIFSVREGNRTFGEVPNGLEGVDKAGLEGQVMRQITGDGEE